jgi:hypothetical protein
MEGKELWPGRSMPRSRAGRGGRNRQVCVSIRETNLNPRQGRGQPYIWHHATPQVKHPPHAMSANVARSTVHR